MAFVSELLTEQQFRRVLGEWMLENHLGERCVGNREDFLNNYPMPDVRYQHTQSAVDINGDLITMMRADIHLEARQTTSGKKGGETFTFYLVLRTFIDTPEAKPDEMGYIVV